MIGKKSKKPGQAAGRQWAPWGSTNAAPNTARPAWVGNGSSQPSGTSWVQSSDRGAANRSNPRPPPQIRVMERELQAPRPVVTPPLANGWQWQSRSRPSASEGQQDDAPPPGGDPDPEENVDGNDTSDDDDDDLSDDLSDKYDSDASEKSFETRKTNKWFKSFFEVLDSLSVEQINEQTRQWHCPACKNGPGAIDWYKGLQPLMTHARTKGSTRVKLHRELAALLEEELSRRGTSVIPAGEQFGKRKGLRESTDREIVWPPMVIVMNTLLEKDDDDKWKGMGNQELLDYFGEYAATKARHAYGPAGHHGMSVLIFESSAVGYMEAERLHRHFITQGTDRNTWQLRRVPFLPGGKRQLYGFLANKEDMETFNKHCQGKSRLKYEMRSYNEMVVIPMKHMSEDNQQLNYLKNKAVKTEQRAKAVEETLGVVTQRLLPDEALLASQLEGARRASIEKAYNVALREAEKRHTGRRTKPTAHWPKDVIEVFQMIYMATCMTKKVRFKRGEENWVNDPIVHDMALELFARTQRAYSGQQLHNKWKNTKLDKIFKEEDQKLDIEGPNLPPPASTPPPQHLGFTATANGIEIDTGQPPIVFKSQLFTLTGIPPECQKIIGKGGTLEDNGNWSDLGVKDGQKLMMIGTNAAITKVLQEEVDTLVIAAANNPSTRELSKSLQLPAIEFLLEENGHKSDLEILRKKMEHLNIENKKDKDELQQENAILKKKLAHAMEEKMELKNQLYMADALRSDMHNQLMELKGSIRVFCRVRPILDKSISEDSAVYCPEKGQFVGRRVYLETSSGAIKAFTCDRVFPPGVSQNDIFVEISGLVKSAMDGKKVCIFAYGQTGSGKTFTMLGDDGDDAKGVIPRAVEEIFETIQIRESSGLAHHTVKIGMSEIYNDEVRNLSSTALNDNVVKTKTQALGALKEALSKRAVAKTSRNERSSRSHFIFRLSIYSYNEKMEMCEGALNIIDLAGSEATDSDATKEVQAEATAIRKSLLYLGTTIGQIERGAEFINFRNSQLTTELQSSLGKNCKVLMFVNVASEKTYAKETAATFEFAARIKSSIKMETLDSKKTQLLKEKEFEFKSPGMSSVRPQKGAFGLNPPFSINIRRTTKQGPSCTKKFDVAPACEKRKLYNND